MATFSRVEALPGGVRPRVARAALPVSAGGLFMMTNFSLRIGFGDAVTARMVQSLGLAFLFVPINTIAFNQIAREKTSYATGLINPARNVGGSTGIATITTLLARHSQFHQQVLVANVTPTNPAYQSALSGMSANLQQHGIDAVDAAHRAQAMLYGMVQRQAAMLAFIDIFWVLGVTFICLIPFMFVMKRMKPHKGAVMVE